MKFNFEKMKGTVEKHAPEILLVTGIVSVVATAILAARGATKAADILAKKKEESEEPVEKKELVKVYAESYGPAVATGIVAIGSMIGAHAINANRIASLANAYALAEGSYKMYQQKVKEVLGEKKEGDVKDEVAREIVKQHPINDKDVIVVGSGDVMCFDSLSGRYFKSSMTKVQKAVNSVNEVMKSENYISLNEFYDELGLPEIELGNLLGWSAGKYVDIRFTTALSGEDASIGEGIPCLVLEYLIGPKEDYRDVWS